MKRRRLPPDQRLKRRYNICHRLRLKGIAVDTDSNAINITGPEELNALPKTTRRYVEALRDEFRFVVQTYIPGGQGSTVVQETDGQPAPAIKFRRKRAH